MKNKDQSLSISNNGLVGSTVSLKKGKRTAKVLSEIVIIGNERIDGGLFLDKPLSGFRYWNIEDLKIINRPMKKNTKIESFVVKSVKKMFKVCNFEFSEKIIKEPNWYSNFSWGEEEKKKFKNWFIKEIKKDLHVTNHQAENEFNYFNLMWGFKDKK